MPGSMTKQKDTYFVIYMYRYLLNVIWKCRENMESYDTILLTLNLAFIFDGLCGDFVL